MNKPVVFIDLHHAGLAHSFRLLIEKRLGGTCLFPIGMDWESSGYWEVHKPYNYNPDTAKQFLQIKPEYKAVGSPPLNTIVKQTNGYYEIKDHFYEDTWKAITLDQFKEHDIDIVIASIPDHWITYDRLVKNLKPKAKLVCHMGNIGWNEKNFLNQYKIKNLLASVAPFRWPATKMIQAKGCFYHQEFPVIPFEPYKEEEPIVISSFVHLTPQKEQIEELEKALGDKYIIKKYGTGAVDGLPKTLKEMYSLMQKSKIGLHLKPGGDGYGHVIYSWAMIGRPIITSLSDYKSKLAYQILIPDMTYYNISQGIDIVRDKVNSLHQNPGYYKFICQNFRNIFNRKVNFHKESIKISEFFNELI